MKHKHNELSTYPDYLRAGDVVRRNCKNYKFTRKDKETASQFKAICEDEQGNEISVSFRYGFPVLIDNELDPALADNI